MVNFWIALVGWLVMMSFSAALGWGMARVKDYYVRWKRVPVLSIDRRTRDLSLDWVEPTDGGEIHAEGRDGESEVITEGGASHTWNGTGRAFLVDRDSLQCFRYADEEEEPVLEAPDTSWTLQERAEGAAEKNLRQAEQPGLWGVVGDLAPAMLLLVTFVVVFVLPTMMWVLNG